MEDKIQKVEKWLGLGSVNIFGRPFAGKDTQGSILAKLLEGELIAGGDILRSYHDQKLIQKIMSTGDLFPTELYMSIVLPFFSHVKLKNKPLFLSAVGRLHGEEEIIMQSTTDSKHPIKAVVLLHLTEDEVRRRFAKSQVHNDRGKRADDTKEVLENRLDKFRNDTIPVIDYYREKGLLIEVDGTLPLQQVTQKILDSLYEKSLV